MIYVLYDNTIQLSLKSFGQFTRHCIVYVVKYTWLFLNAQFYAVLHILHCKCIFYFLSFKQLITRNQHYFWNQPKPIQLLKTCKKICISVWNFYMKIINNKHTLLYNLPTIHWIQRYTGLYELTNWMNMKVVISLCASLEVFFPHYILHNIHVYIFFNIHFMYFLHYFCFLLFFFF